MAKPRLLLFFVDGLGIGPPGLANPLWDGRLRSLRPVRMLYEEGDIAAAGFFATGINPLTDVPGIPQSATGQTALLTGVHAAKLLGHHLSGFPNRPLRDVISRESVFLQLARKGLLGNFANAFTPEFFPKLKENRLSVTTWATLAGGRPLATLSDLQAGRAVYQDFTNLHLVSQNHRVPFFTPEDAGAVLASMAEDQDFLLYEYFLTDFAGHGGDLEFARTILCLLDRFVTACLDCLNLCRVTALLASDHGNVEDLASVPHTRHPVPFLAWGAGASYFSGGRLRSLTDVTPAIVDYLSHGP